MRGRSQWACVALALGLATTAVAACTTSSSPPVESTTSATTTTSSSATSTSTTASTATTTLAGSDVPEAARANSADGATAFTKYFAERSNSAFNNLEPTQISTLSLSTCQSCANMVASISDWKSKNQRYVGTFVNPVYVTISAFPGDDSAKVLLATKTGGAKVVDSSGAVVKSFPAESGNVIYALSYRDGRWMVETIKAAA